MIRQLSSTVVWKERIFVETSTFLVLLAWMVNDRQRPKTCISVSRRARELYFTAK